MRKIKFEVMIANNFGYSKPNGINNEHLWPISSPDGESLDITLEFEPTSTDIMKEAEKELDEFIKENYPNKEYKIYYWDWLG